MEHQSCYLIPMHALHKYFYMIYKGALHVNHSNRTRPVNPSRPHSLSEVKDDIYDKINNISRSQHLVYNL